MQVSTKSVLSKTLKRLAKHENNASGLDHRFSNYYAKKTKTDLVRAARVASEKARG